MTAVEYLKAKNRMTKDKEGICKIKCSDCPISSYNNGFNLHCYELENKHPEKAVEIVSKWAKENPPKTILQDFLEKYPNAPLRDEDGTPRFCPFNIGYKDLCTSEKDENCKKCWNRSLEEAQCQD